MEHFQEQVLGFLWRQWSALGVAGPSQSVDRWMLDPEALLLATTSLGRDPRLFDEVLDWLNTNGQFINLQRLQNLRYRACLEAPMLLRHEGGADGKPPSESNANRRLKAVSVEAPQDYSA